MEPNDTPKTLLEAVKYFADPAVCFKAMIGAKWPDGKIACPKCNGEAIGVITSRSMLQCKAKDCRKQFSCKVGTIFEDSPLGLDKWFVAVWCIANAKNGISSCELARSLGVTQKTAWFMLHRIRLAMKTKSFRKFSGEVETDETFVGGKADNMHKHKREKKIVGRGAVGKAIVHGLLERGDVSQVQANVIGSTDASVLLPAVRQSVAAGAEVYSDGARGYGDLCLTHRHATVDHIETYVSGRVHTNGIENFWALLKRGLKGTYVAVAPYHLSRYVDEQVYRFNKRKKTDSARFLECLANVLGRRLTWRNLTAQGDSGFMGIK
jgi:transposase-like protein